MTLGKARFWVYFDAEAQDIAPLQIIKRVHAAYEAIWQLKSSLNPVYKVSLLVCDYEGWLIIEELFDKEPPAHDDKNSPGTPEILNRRWSKHLSEMQAVFG